MPPKRKQKPSSSYPKDAATLILSPFLFLGPCAAASNSAFLATNSVTHVISVGATPSSTVTGVIYERLTLSDSPSSSIKGTVEKACELIQKAMNKQETNRVLIHCSAAVSRSPTIVAAYLMKCHHFSLFDALGTIIKARPTVCPNSGFIRQLRVLEIELFKKTTLEADVLPLKKEDRVATFKTTQKQAKGAVQKV